MSKFVSFVLLIALALICVPSTALAALTPEQKKQGQELQTAVKKAGNLLTQKKYKESADAVRQAQELLDKLAEGADKDLLKILEPIHATLKKTHGQLELEGYELPALKELGPAKQADKTTPGKPGEKPAAGGKTSFVNQVAPILVTKCGRCHVSDKKGMVSMATFADFAKGPPVGVIFFKGDAAGSRIIEVIESGDMPRGGAKVTAPELATLKAWITEGAVFDGDDPKANLSTLAAGAKPVEAPPVTIAQATGKESVSFKLDVAPVLAKSCTSCHGTNRPRAMFSMINITSLMKGGDSGSPIVPGKPADSLLIQKLKGTASGQRMPLMQAPLADEVIAKIEKWIAEGAKYDAPDPNQDIATVAALARAQAATHEELAADRMSDGLKNWALGMPGNKPNQLETKNFFLVGSIGEATLEDFGKQAEDVVPKVAALFHASTDQPLLKGRLTFFFFEQRYDYSEFGQMVERRELPKEWRGHWRNTIVDAYGAVIPPRGGEYGAEVLLGQQIAGAYVANLGKNTPRWFPEGAARVTASKLGPTDPRVAAWDQQLPEIIAGMEKPDDFLTGKLPPEPADICSYSFVRFLMNDAKKFNGLLDSLRKGEDFKKAFAASYAGSPEQVAVVWRPNAAKKPAAAKKPPKK